MGQTGKKEVSLLSSSSSISVRDNFQIVPLSMTMIPSSPLQSRRQEHMSKRRNCSPAFTRLNAKAMPQEMVFVSSFPKIVDSDRIVVCWFVEACWGWGGLFVLLKIMRCEGEKRAKSCSIEQLDAQHRCT